MERATDLGGAESERGAGGLVDEGNETGAIHHDLGNGAHISRGVNDQTASLHMLLAARERIGEEGQPLSHHRASHLSEHSPLEVVGREQVGVGDEHLGLAQKQVAALVEREVEVPEYLRLRLGREVHERVARHEQIDARDRGVLDEVVAAIYDCAPQVWTEAQTVGHALEVALDELVGDVLEGFGRVRGVPGDGERVIVDIGGIHLDPLAELGLAERLG